MPPLFVVSEVGPLEPNLYRAIEHESPKVSVRDLPEEITAFIETIWRIYGARPIDSLNRLVMQDRAYKEAKMTGGIRAIIGLDAMCRHYTASRKSEPLAKLPEKLPDEIPNIIAEIISAARDEAREVGAIGSDTVDGGDKSAAAWIPGLVAEN